MQSMFDERQWLAWLVKVRIIILTFLLGIELAIARLTPNPMPLRLFIEVVLLWYTISVFYLVLLSFWEEYRIQSLLQVLTDLALVTLVVYATGGVDSSLNFLYPLVIIVASMLLPRRLAYFAIIPSYSTTHPHIRLLQAIILINLVAYFAVAYLTGLLAAKLRQVDVKLKYARGALKNLQALHENIIQSITGGLITTGLDGHITLVNTAAKKLLQSSDRELWGQPVEKLFLDPLPSASSEPAHGEVRFIAPNGFRNTFRVTAAPLTIPDRGAIGHVYMLDDLTEIRRLERDLRMQDRLAAVGRLAAAIAHEIRNPLTSIAGSVSMLSGIPDLSEEHRQLLEIVTRESERLNGIITDFLAYSRGKQYQFSKVDLLPLLEDTLTLLENRLVSQNLGIHIVRQFVVSEAMALADGDKIKQVFWNFCENAVRAMRDGGSLTVSVEPVGEDWQINFSDTGSGMTPQIVEKIFEPFQSNFEGGTGLGLAIVYQIVQAHEGKVWARSKVGQGSVFVLRLRRMGAPEIAAAGRVGQPALAAAASQSAAIGGRANG